MDSQSGPSFLGESLLYRSSRGFGTFTGEDVAVLLYVNTLALCVALQDWSTARAAIKYTTQTSRRMNYSLFYQSCTDLYALAYMVSNPSSKRNLLADNAASTAHLRSLSFNPKMHVTAMMRLARSGFSASELATYLYRLEVQLSIKNAELKAVRRMIPNWGGTSQGARRSALMRIRRVLLTVGKTPNQEMLKMLNRLRRVERFRHRGLRTPVAGIQTLGAVAAGAAAGAVVGNAVADKYTVPAAGLGAIAGYWASRRPRK